MSGRSCDEAGRIASNGYSYGIGIPRDEALRNLPGKAPDEADVVLDLIKQLAVYGGGRHTWPLHMDSKLERIGGRWRITWTKASTY